MARDAAGAYGDAEKAAAAAGSPDSIGFMEIDELEPFQHLLEESQQPSGPGSNPG